MSRCWKDISLEECEVPLSSVERKGQNIVKGEISRTRREEKSVNKKRDGDESKSTCCDGDDDGKDESAP